MKVKQKKLENSWENIFYRYYKEVTTKKPILSIIGTNHKCNSF